jgi:hypothetical protein
MSAAESLIVHHDMYEMHIQCGLEFTFKNP